jgi:tetraacyldisaccharide 4'-kinase
LQSERVRVPVISVGNLVVGGSGKTPVTGWLVETLRRGGQTPAVLHGGYAADEPALHRAWHPDIPVYAGKDRVASANEAIRNGATVLVLDDGLQHLRLARDLDLVLIAAEHWQQPRRLLPAGVWREELNTLRDVEVIAITRKAASHAEARDVAAEIQASTGGHAPCIIALKLEGFFHAGLPSASPTGALLALSSIADPLAFARQLLQAGLEVSEVLAFGDHHEYRLEDLRVVRAAAKGRPVVTTEKDAVKLQALDPELDIWIARQTVVVETGRPQLDAALDAALLMPRST